MFANNTTEIRQSGSELDKIAFSIQKTYLWILTGVGIPANILVILIVLSMQRKTSGTFLLAALAFFDACALVVKISYQQLPFYGVTNAAFCKLISLNYFFSAMSTWTLIFFCIERSVAACSDRKNSNNRLGLTRCFFTLFATVLMILSFYLAFFFYAYDYNPKIDNCILISKYKYMWLYFSWVNESIQTMIPFAVLILLAVILALAGCLGQRRRAGYHSIDDPSTETVGKDEPVDERLERSLTLMAFSTAILVFLFLIPSFVYFLCSYLRLPWSYLFSQVKYLLFDGMHAIKFFVYLLVTDVFRKYFCKVCCGASVDITKHQETITVE